MDDRKENRSEFVSSNGYSINLSNVEPYSQNFDMLIKRVIMILNE